jgi:hypothetical protein
MKKHELKTSSREWLTKRKEDKDATTKKGKTTEITIFVKSKSGGKEPNS